MSSNQAEEASQQPSQAAQAPLEQAHHEGGLKFPLLGNTPKLPHARDPSKHINPQDFIKQSTGGLQHTGGHRPGR
ncbi:unnamed protein product [Cyberlindnera jadinii]|uniref:Uncharacterized protein n=1 Tax=Cyberlindnera jadinii (strain ATCC 18201 / CBS 1600 / BCRC 20928 / JCM 3617 / NBRC 0987 / NRRL Y-1542) TaxID=983966 RepID=A0A0H5BYR9_CYBJN|nr:unnamed protein product [Cyberlindnera jadinii]